MSYLEPDARKAMLARLATGLTVLADAPRMRWTCCNQDFDHVNTRGHTEHWAWRFCNGGQPGDMWGTRPCGHWHHQHEPPLIALGAS